MFEEIFPLHHSFFKNINPWEKQQFLKYFNDKEIDKPSR